MRAPARPNDFENVRRTTTTPSSSSGSSGLARVLEVRLVDDERPRVGQVAELAGRVVRAAGEREGRVGVADLRAGELRRDPVERVRGRLRRSRPSSPGPGEGARAEQDQVVGARAEHDVLGLDARVVARSPREQLAVAAVPG